MQRTFEPLVTLVTPLMAEAYLDFLKALDSEAQYMHYRQGERSMDTNGMASRLRKMQKQGSSFVLVARNLMDGIIGYFSVNAGNSASSKHSATVAVGVLKEYQGMGVAHDLLEAAKRHSVRLGVERYECTVVLYNSQAVRFYDRHGFYSIGVLHKRFCAGAGDYLDELILEYFL